MLGDVRFRIAPLTDRDADELLHGIRGFKLLEGFRGQPPADLDALRELLLRISRLAEEVPEVSELDLNPVIALARATDAASSMRASMLRDGRGASRAVFTQWSGLAGFSRILYLVVVVGESRFSSRIRRETGPTSEAAFL